MPDSIWVVATLAMPFLVRYCYERHVKWLKEQECEVWIAEDWRKVS